MQTADILYKQIFVIRRDVSTIFSLFVLMRTIFIEIVVGIYKIFLTSQDKLFNQFYLETYNSKHISF